MPGINVYPNVDGTVAAAIAAQHTVDNGTYLAPAFPEQYGVLGNGTDESTALQAMLTACANKTIFFDPTKTYRADSALTHPGGYIAFRSTGGPHDRVNPSGSAGAKLDLRYNGFRIQCLQPGTLDVEGITFTNGGSSTGTYLLFTTAVPQIRGNVFIGRSGVTGTTCDEDAVQLGGSGSSISNGSTTSAFGGYGGWVEKNAHTKMRRGFYGRCFTNSIIVRDNYFDGYCGVTGTGTSTPAAIEIDPGSGGGRFANGSIIEGNLIEAGNYVYGIALRGATGSVRVGPNSFWDSTGTTVAGVRLDSTAQLNTVDTSGFCDAPDFIEDASSLNRIVATRRRVFVASGNMSSNTTASYTTVFTTGSVIASCKSLLVSLTGFSSISLGGAVAIFQIGNGTVDLTAGSFVPEAGASHATAALFTGLTVGQAYTFTVKVEVSGGTWNCRAASYPGNENLIVTVEEAA